VHTGVAFVGNVGEGDASDFTAVGDPVNATARLASTAGAGEILVSAAAAAAEAAGFDTAGLEGARSSSVAVTRPWTPGSRPPSGPSASRWTRPLA
jgi:class 3 adenylate cyclase